MGQADWQTMDGALSSVALKREVTAGITPPNGATNVFGWRCLDGTVTGAHGMYLDLTGFTPTGSGPTAKDGGGQISGCVRRVASANNEGFSPFLYFCAQSSPPSVNDMAYLIGLSDADPYKIMVAKGLIVSGLNPAADDLFIIGESSDSYVAGDGLWHHVKLEVIVQPTGDVLLKAFYNNLTAHPIGTSPVWTAIPGISADGILDDNLGLETGSPPLWGGYCGFAMNVASALNRCGAVCAIQAWRQT